MQFVITAYDGENMLEKRVEVRPRHLEGMNRMMEHVWERIEVEAMNVVILGGRKYISKDSL